MSSRKNLSDEICLAGLRQSTLGDIERVISPALQAQRGIARIQLSREL